MSPPTTALKSEKANNHSCSHRLLLVLGQTLCAQRGNVQRQQRLVVIDSEISENRYMSGIAATADVRSGRRRSRRRTLGSKISNRVEVKGKAFGHLTIVVLYVQLICSHRQVVLSLKPE